MQTRREVVAEFINQTFNQSPDAAYRAADELLARLAEYDRSYNERLSAEFQDFGG